MTSFIVIWLKIYLFLISDKGDFRKEVSQVEGEYMTKTTKSILRLVPRKLYNHIIATCKIEHPSFEKPISYSVNVSVECEFWSFGPDLITDF